MAIVADLEMAAVLAAPETEILEAAREAVHTAVEQQTISIALVAGGRAVSFAVRRSEDTSSFAKTPSPVGGHMGRCGRDSLTLWKISHWHEILAVFRQKMGWLDPQFSGRLLLGER